MLLVVMAAVLVVGGTVGEAVGPSCESCRLTSYNLPLKNCGSSRNVTTEVSVCAGHCLSQDTNFPDRLGSSSLVCLGSWSREVRQVAGCSTDVTISVAQSCRCARCDENHNCDRFTELVPRCPGRQEV